MTRPLIDPETMADAKSDFSDMASAHEAMNLAAALRNRPVVPFIPPRGECLFCEAEFELGDDRRWCDADCRDDWQKLAERLRQNTVVHDDQ